LDEQGAGSADGPDGMAIDVPFAAHGGLSVIGAFARQWNIAPKGPKASSGQRM
jgi:hypothetical protein